MSHAPHSGESTGSLWNHDLAPALPSQAAGKRIDQKEWAMPTPKAVRELWFS